jgi:hypothetical protein
MTVCWSSATVWCRRRGLQIPKATAVPTATPDPISSARTVQWLLWRSVAQEHCLGDTDSLREPVEGFDELSEQVGGATSDRC